MARCYRQLCSIAHALDVVGERWTLLILRDLMPGPLRYRDLAAKQPGLASDMLTRRLRRLEGAGIIERRELPPPAGITVYGLREPSDTVRHALEALVGLGASFMPDPATAGERMEVAWAMMSVRPAIEAPAGGGLAFPDEVVPIRVLQRGETCRVVYHALEDPAVILGGPTSRVLAYLFGFTDERSMLKIDGAPDELAAWRRALVSAAQRVGLFPSMRRR
ncbi:MAG: helix-turn-helix domain-containing protein [Myxococcota bacterium]